MGLSLKNKRTISMVLIIIGLPLAIASASSGGGTLAFVFGALLAIGVDMLTDTLKDNSLNR